MLRWMQFGDLHACEGDGWRSLNLFERIVAEVNNSLANRLHFAVLPGDNANHATVEQFKRISDISKGLRLPLHILPGDHDYEAGHLNDFRRHLAPSPLPRVEAVGDSRVVFLDIVSAGSGGPNFRLGQPQTAWLRRLLAEDVSGSTIVFMHAFPGDLKEEGASLAQMFADAGVSYVGTGHTHYNDLLNDGHVIYGATRSTGETEEGHPGFSISALDGDVVSWRFKTLDSRWPLVLITSPSDLRLVTNSQSRSQVPERSLTVRAEVFGSESELSVIAQLDGVHDMPLTVGDDGTWTCRFYDVPDGLRVLTVTATCDHGSDTDTIEVLLRNARERPKRGVAASLGTDVHSIRSWPSHGIPGGRLGPNANGRKW